MSSDLSPHLSLPYLVPDQAQKHVSVNQALRRLDAMVQVSVISRTLAAPPDAPHNGDRYLLPEAGAHEWGGAANELAVFEDTGWVYLTPRAGWRVWQQDAQKLLVFDGAAWRDLATSSGDRLSLTRTRTEFDFSTDLPTAMIPAHHIFFGVSGLVRQAITGPTSWHIGVSDGLTRFGTDIALTEATTVQGPADPPAVYWQDTPIVLTPIGGAFTGGELTLDLFSFSLPVPT